MPSESAAIFYGLLAALVWGAGDFSGGLASKRTNVYAVIFISQSIGGIFLLLLAVAVGEPLPDPSSISVGGSAGVAGVVGLLFFYRGLAAGQMGVVAPVAAVFTTTLPMLVGLWLEGFPGLLPSVGFLLAIFAIVLFSLVEGGKGFTFKDLHMPVIAGIGFAFFFILIDRVAETAVYWPLVSARAASTSVIVLAARRNGQPLHAEKDRLPVIAIAGIFDAGGNVFFTLASHFGRLDIVATLASLYTGVTVLLAYAILKERLTDTQRLGVFTALMAVVLISR